MITNNKSCHNYRPEILEVFSKKTHFFDYKFDLIIIYSFHLCIKGMIYRSATLKKNYTKTIRKLQLQTIFPAL